MHIFFMFNVSENISEKKFLEKDEAEDHTLGILFRNYSFQNVPWDLETSTFERYLVRIN